MDSYSGDSVRVIHMPKRGERVATDTETIELCERCSKVWSLVRDSQLGTHVLTNTKGPSPIYDQLVAEVIEYGGRDVRLPR